MISNPNITGEGLLSSMRIDWGLYSSGYTGTEDSPLGNLKTMRLIRDVDPSKYDQRFTNTKQESGIIDLLRHPVEEMVTDDLNASGVDTEFKETIVLEEAIRYDFNRRTSLIASANQLHAISKDTERKIKS